MCAMSSMELSKELQEHIINGGFLYCKDYHEGTCLYSAILRFIKTFKNSYKYYIPIHLIPLLIFKRKKIKESPKKTLGHALYNYLKSVVFISLYVAICKYSICKLKNIRGVIDGWNPALSASVASVALYLEPESRR